MLALISCIIIIIIIINTDETQANLPPSEQQVQEPKKYMGGAIPSRSFKILQAMTAPESVGELIILIYINYITFL